MPSERFTFNDSKLNKTIQVGDTMYYASNINDSGVLTKPILVGTISAINQYSVNFNIEVEVNTLGAVPNDSFILFSKPIKINESGLKGYYADVILENTSKKRAELFAVSSELMPSSK